VSFNDLSEDRLKGLDDRLKSVEKDYDRILQKVREHQVKELNDIYTEFHQEEREFQLGIVNTLFENREEQDNKLIEVQSGFISALDQQGMFLNQKLCDMETGIKADSVELIDGFGMRISEALESYMIEKDSEIKKIQSEIQSQGEMKRSIALDAYQSVCALFDYVSNHYPIEQYYPNALQELFHKIEQSNFDIERGLFEAGLIEAQNVSRELEKIRMSVKEKEFLRKSFLSATREKFNELYEIAKSCQLVNAIGINQEDLGIDIDVAFWSGNRYKQLLSKIRSTILQLEKNGVLFREDELKHLLDTELLKLKDELEQSVYWARRNVLSSQIRFNIASRVVQALGEQGFILSSGSYAESDQRCLYHVHLIHMDGSEVTVEVKEIENEISSSQLELESLDASVRTEHELRQRAYEVARSLQNYGLRVGKNRRHEETSTYPILTPNTGNYAAESKRSILEQKGSYGRN
jgi:hypothetical protein